MSAAFFYFCPQPTFVEGCGQCVTCDGMLARGDFAFSVPEERYEISAAERFGEGLSWLERERLSGALFELAGLALHWALAGDEEPTRVDAAHPA